MKKLLLFLMAVMLMVPAIAFAGPFLVSDPQTGEIDNYEVSFDNGATWEVTAPQAVTGGVRLHYDLVDLVDGTTYDVIARACNAWGCSNATSPLSFTAGAPASPSGVGLSAD